ncbi:MAG: zinc metalloprotease HtpX [Gammaproteobacteria bacterium]|nr:zinc metalloprotease HtpX [Gammaproteobacteria bacterium]
MMDYSSVPDWRGQLRRNQSRTRWVIIVFVLIYAMVGLLLDVLFYSQTYPEASPSSLFQALLSLQLFPFATSILIILSLVSLWVTYALYDKIMLFGTEYKEITPKTAKNLSETQLYNVVEELKLAAGLQFVPRVFLIDADYMNAFASGYSDKSAMVAITRGLVEKLDRDELQAVMAHELSHIRHMDIKLTLTASVLSNLILMVVDMLFYSVLYGRDERDRKGGQGLVVIIMLLRFLLPLITLLLMLYLSRLREYMADAGCVELMRDNSPLAKALMKIDQDHQTNKENYRQQYARTAHEDVRRAAYIYDPIQAGIEPVTSLSGIFSTHPSIKERLKALGVLPSSH